jgi:hypothetical protein
VEGLREEEEAVSARRRSPATRGSPWTARAIAVAAGLALAGAGGDARADDQSTAEELFERGRKLMGSNATLGEACRTLQESLKLMDRGDTMLNLAECHRRQGKTATAWAEFDKALSHGAKVGFSEAIQTATRLREALAAKLSKLTVTVPPETAALAGLTVEVDGNPWPRERWNTAIVIDPGAIRITARATGYKPFEVQVQLGADKDAKSVVVALEVEPPPPPPPPRPPPPAPVARPPRPVWPWIAGAAGVALGGAAIGSEIVSRRASSELTAKCGPDHQSCRHPYEPGPARTRELLGYGLFVGLGAGGVLALGAAGVGLVRSSRAQTTSPTLVVSPSSVSFRFAF